MHNLILLLRLTRNYIFLILCFSKLIFIFKNLIRIYEKYFYYKNLFVELKLN